MDLENWILELLDNIKTAALDGDSFEVTLTAKAVQEIAEAYENSQWIEIY